MAIFDGIGSQATKNITDALPGVEKTITDAVSAVQVLVGQTLVPILADVVSQVLGEFDRLDGASITIAPSSVLTVTVNIPSF